MTEHVVKRKAQWCIVVADDHGPEYGPSTGRGEIPTPVQYCRLGEPATLLQKALNRARQIAPPAQIMVTARDEYRDQWEPALWFVSPPHRFVSDKREVSALTTAAALLSIAADSSSNIVTILPARCYVAHECILSAALQEVRAVLPRIREGVATLGMVDIDDGIDEDYLVAARVETGPGLRAQAIVRKPTTWVARYLRRQGAMVMSGILVGYAGIFAAHISKCWPGLTNVLTRLVAASSADDESRFSASIIRGVPSVVLRSLRWRPPIFPQRAFRVYHCGWSGLHSAQAVARISASVQLNPGSASAAAVESGDSRWQAFETAT
jgi:hypothetical protein